MGRLDVLPVECGDQGETLISADAADVQRDGIHLVVANSSGSPVNLAVGEAAYFGLRTGAQTEVVFGLAPGEWAVQCFRGEERPDPTGVTPIRFEDRRQAWIPPNLECAASSRIVSAGLTNRPSIHESPRAAARRVIWRLPADARLQRAGYMEADEPLVRVSTHTSIVGILRFTHDQSRWAIAASKCTGSGLHFTTGGF